MDIKFDSLNSLASNAFAKACPADYSDGRYSGTILKFEPVTTDSKGHFCLRGKVNIAIDRHEGKPNLFVSDQITFTTRKENEDGSAIYEISWAAVNSFCDLAALCGADRNEVYAQFKKLSKFCTNGDKTGIRDSFIAICEYAKLFAGSRVAPNIVWSKDELYANVRGSRATPAYLSAARERDMASEFTADDTDTNPPAPARRQYNLLQPMREVAKPAKAKRKSKSAK